eukprot:15474855-Alexandrium_andersonii.AAC.1
MPAAGPPCAVPQLRGALRPRSRRPRHPTSTWAPRMAAGRHRPGGASDRVLLRAPVSGDARA